MIGARNQIFPPFKQEVEVEISIIAYTPSKDQYNFPAIQIPPKSRQLNKLYAYYDQVEGILILVGKCIPDRDEVFSLQWPFTGNWVVHGPVPISKNNWHEFV